MLLRILGYLCQLCFIIGLYYGLKSQEAFLQYTVCILAILILLQRIFIDLSLKNRHKAQRKAKFYINKCRSASCMQGGLKQASA